MSDPRFMTAIMCDDVRREEGNKFSYMGIYSSNLVLPDFPIALPKLCFVMSVICPAHDEPPRNLAFRLFRDEELLAEVRIPEDELAKTRMQATEADDREAKRLTIGAVVQIFPLQLQGPCSLKVRALCDGEELKGGSWPVEKATV